METKKYVNSKENGLFQDDHLKKIKLEITNESSCSLKSETSHLPFSQSKLKGLVTDDMLLVLKSPTKENQIISSNHSGKNEILQHKEMHSKLAKGSKRNTGFKLEHNNVKFLKLDKTDLDNSNSLGMGVKLELKSFDLKKEQKDNGIAGRKSDDLIENSNNHFNYMETRLNKIPKDILGKYGIVIEDSDMCRVSPGPEDRLNVLNEEIEEEEEEGRLIIDEEERPARNTNRENSSQHEISENETDFPIVDLSSEENTEEFTNSGHHLVISSVRSLQGLERCDVCEVQLPFGDSLKLHKKGHCSFPGCLDFIPNDAEREKHLRIHKAHPIKPFRCDHCKKRFRYYRFTKKHREACMAQKRSKCPYCNYYSCKIKKHIAKHVQNFAAHIAGKAALE